MSTWTRIIGVLVALYAVFVIYRGRISVSNDYNHNTSWIVRSERPLRFWFTVVIMFVVAAIMIFNIFHL